MIPRFGRIVRSWLGHVSIFEGITNGLLHHLFFIFRKGSEYFVVGEEELPIDSFFEVHFSFSEVNYFDEFEGDHDVEDYSYDKK